MFKNTMVILGVLLVGVLCAACYRLGLSQAKIKYITNEVEVVKYEKNCAVNLINKPNIDDDALVWLFDSGQL